MAKPKPAPVEEPKATTLPVNDLPPDAVQVQPNDDAPATPPTDPPAQEPAPAVDPNAPAEVPDAVAILAESSDDSHLMKAIKAAAEDGWAAFVGRDDLAGALKRYGIEEGAVSYHELSPLEKLGIWAIVLSTINTPHGESVGSVMPDNNDRRTVRLLESALRGGLGYAEKAYSE